MQYGLKFILDRNGRIAQMRAAATDGVAWCVSASLPAACWSRTTANIAETAEPIELDEKRHFRGHSLEHERSVSLGGIAWSMKESSVQGHKKAINDKLQGSVATYLRCSEVVNN